MTNYFRLLKTNFLILTIALVLSSCVGSITDVSPGPINYGIQGDLYIASTNQNINFVQKGIFSNKVNFFVNPNLPDGLSIDIDSGNITGTASSIPSVPSKYTIMALTSGKEYYEKVLTLGISPSMVWITNHIPNPNPYHLKAYVWGDAYAQEVDWNSSNPSVVSIDDSGLLSFKPRTTPGSTKITATGNAHASSIDINVEAVTNTRFGQEIRMPHGDVVVIIHNGLTFIEEGRFLAQGITSLVILDNIQLIEGMGFALNNFTSIYLPDSIKNIEPTAFTSPLEVVSLKESLYNEIKSQGPDALGLAFGVNDKIKYIKRP